MVRVLCLLLTAAMAAPTWAATLGDLRWERRIVLAYGEPGGAEMVRLQDLVKLAACAVAERDLDVYRASGREAVPLTPAARPLDDPRIDALRGGADGFQVVLVGKDGGVKARSTDPDALGEFLEGIDTMPMRRREMATRGTDCER